MGEDSQHNILNNINQIEDKLKELEKEKTNIQDNCSHKEWTVNFDERRSIKRYCSECKRELGYATKEESTNFLRPRG